MLHGRSLLLSFFSSQVDRQYYTTNQTCKDQQVCCCLTYQQLLQVLPYLDSADRRMLYAFPWLNTINDLFAIQHKPQTNKTTCNIMHKQQSDLVLSIYVKDGDFCSTLYTINRFSYNSYDTARNNNFKSHTASSFEWLPWREDVSGNTRHHHPWTLSPAPFHTCMPSFVI